MKLSVVILNYNVHHFLELCLKSVEAAVDQLNAEIIVVDNNSSDGSCNMVKQKFPKVLLVENNENVGFSKANNQGVAIAKGEYVCILNPDTVVAEDTFLKLIRFAEGKANLGIVGCRLIDGTGSFLPESKRNVPLVKIALQKMRGDSSRYYANHIKENDVAKVDVLVGAFMFLKRSVYNKIDGFDETYFMYGEDIDMSFKALKRGLDNYYFGKTTVVHYKGESTLKDKTYARRFYKAMQIFYKKHFKTNMVFDAFVWFGIKLAYILRKERRLEKKKIENYYLISDKENESLDKVLNNNVILKSVTNSIPDNTEVIFDANTLTYKQIIIEFSELKKKNSSITFKILPNKSTFIIGSDSSFGRGEVVFFEQN